MDNFALQQLLQRAQHVLAILTEEVACPILPSTSDIDNELERQIHDDFVNVLTEPAQETALTGPRRNLDKEREVIEGILQYVTHPVHGPARSRRIVQLIHETWNIELKSDSTCKSIITATHEYQLENSDDFLNRLQQIHNGSIFATGSVAAGTSLRGSDYDFCTPDDLGIMKQKTRMMRAAFSDFNVEKCWGTKKPDANLPLLNIGCRDNDGSYYSVDLCATTVTNVLAQKTMGLPLDERMHIIAAKVFFSKMKLMRVVKMRLTSSFFTVAYLCMKNDPTSLAQNEHFRLKLWNQFVLSVKHLF